MTTPTYTPPPRDTTCYTCQATPGQATRGWAGQPSYSGVCPDCRGTGVDQTPFGTGMDSCPWCAADWKRSHDPGCPCA